MSLARFKEMLREQYLLVRLDEERALRALPKLLGDDAAARKARRWMSCTGFWRRVATCPTKASAGWRRSRHCSVRGRERQ